MEDVFKRVRLVVVQPEELVYFDKYYSDALTALSKFNYFCQLAKVSYEKVPNFVFDRTNIYREMSVYFPENKESEKNQSGFVQVSLYFET